MTTTTTPPQIPAPTETRGVTPRTVVWVELPQTDADRDDRTRMPATTPPPSAKSASAGTAWRDGFPDAHRIHSPPVAANTCSRDRLRRLAHQAGDSAQNAQRVIPMERAATQVTLTTTRHFILISVPSVPLGCQC